MGVAALADTVAPTCDKALELIVSNEDVGTAHRLCFLQNTNEDIAQLVVPACDYAQVATPTLTRANPVTGTLTAGGSDWWTFTASAGQIINISIAADNPGTLDTYLLLLTAVGETIAQNDDFDGTDSRLDKITIPASGTSFVVVRGFSDIDIGNYTLTWQ
jgi:hypothetical protein